MCTPVLLFNLKTPFVNHVYCVYHLFDVCRKCLCSGFFMNTAELQEDGKYSTVSNKPPRNSNNNNEHCAASKQRLKIQWNIPLLVYKSSI